jgi:hypothetical protein
VIDGCRGVPGDHSCFQKKEGELMSERKTAQDVEPVQENGKLPKRRMTKSERAFRRTAELESKVNAWLASKGNEDVLDKDGIEGPVLLRMEHGS